MPSSNLTLILRLIRIGLVLFCHKDLDNYSS